MPDHRISTEQLLAFAAGELDAAERTSIEQHLSGCRDCSETIERFHRVRAVLRAAEGEQPSQSLIARAQAIHRPLIDALARKPQPVALTGHALLRRWALAAALLVCIVLAGGGVRVLAANAVDSLPGDTIYRLKLAGEDLQLAMTLDTTDQVKQHLALARTREQELAKLVALGRLDVLQATTRAAQDQMDQAIQGLLRLSRQDQAGAVALAPVIEQALAKHMQVLTGLLATAPPSARPGLEQAISASQNAQSSIESTVRPGAGYTPTAEAHPAEATSTLTQGGLPQGPKNTPAGPGKTPPGAPPVNTPRESSAQTQIPPVRTRTPPGPNRTPTPEKHGGR
jgi:Domain of unknown function (DUF5667)/Putative zinc-finger